MSLDKKSILVGLIFLAVSGTAAALDSDDAIVLSSFQYKDGEKDGIVKNSYLVKKDNFQQYSFNKPFMVNVEEIVENNGIKSIKTINSFLDCKEQRYAIQSENNIENFSKKENVPLSAWKTISKSASLYEKVCSQTQGYDKNHKSPKNQIKDWKFFELNSNYVYVNLNDVKKGDTNKPFTIRSKRFDSTFTNMDEKNKKSSVIDEILIDCKNNQYSLMKSTYYGNDFEYQPNPKAKAIDTTEGNKKWYELGDDIKTGLGMCK